MGNVMASIHAGRTDSVEEWSPSISDEERGYKDRTTISFQGVNVEKFCFLGNIGANTAKRIFGVQKSAFLL